MQNFDKILVAVDFSKPSVKALEIAVSLCDRLGAELHLIYIADMENVDISRQSSEEATNIETKMINDLEQQLKELAVKHTDNRVTYNTHIKFGDPAEEISAVAAEMDVKMIVIGTHGRTGLEHLLMGSIAENVLRIATVPVICVRGSTVKSG